MTREEQKQYNAENYPASVLSWLNEATDRAYDDFESRTCENCKHNLKNRGLQKGCVIVEISPLDMVKDFGCNKFEAKETK